MIPADHLSWKRRRQERMRQQRLARWKHMEEMLCQEEQEEVLLQVEKVRARVLQIPCVYRANSLVWLCFYILW